MELCGVSGTHESRKRHDSRTGGSQRPVREKQDMLWEYLRNLFKKMRTAATYVLVIMVADEARRHKPYSLPVQYIPYARVRDQHLRDLLRELKTTMCGLGLKVEGNPILT